MLTLELSSRLLEIPQWCVYNKHSVNSDRLFDTQSWVLQVDWFIFEINEKATLNIDMPYYYFVIPGKKRAIYSSLTFLCSHLSFPATQVLHHWWVLNGVCQSWPQQHSHNAILIGIARITLWKSYIVTLRPSCPGNYKIMQCGILGVILVEQRQSSSLWLSLLRS